MKRSMKRFMKSLPKLRLQRVVALLLGLLSAAGAGAGEADVLSVDVDCKAPKQGQAVSICRIWVKLQHADTGWKHYANRYDVLDMQGNLIASRVLRHPHVDEQPFRRRLGPIAILREVENVKVRAHDLVHGLGGAEVTAEIPHAAGEALEQGSQP